jgi:epoxyqueuosine reductase QueG
MGFELEIKAEAQKGGALVCGIAAAGAFDAAPEGARPADLLPGARAVVVLGGAQPRAGEWASPHPAVLHTMGTSDRINAAARRVSVFIEDKLGYYGLHVPPGSVSGHDPIMSLMLAAEMAGIGTRSLAGPILNSEHGLLYLAAVITTAPLQADGPLAEPVCPAPSCVEMWDREGTTPCLAVCPINAGGCLGGRLENGRVAERVYDRELCHSRVHTHWIGGFQKVLEGAIAEPDRERRKHMLYGDYFTRTLWAMTYSASNIAQCFECMRVCPVGAERRTKK